MRDSPRINVENFDVLRAHLLGLSIDCPTGEVLCGCFFNKTRSLSVKEKWRWINAHSQSELVEIYNNHYRCLQQQEDY